MPPKSFASSRTPTCRSSILVRKTDAKSLIPFLGIARKGANLNVSHDWKKIKKSIEDGWSEEAAEKERRVCGQ